MARRLLLGQVRDLNLPFDPHLLDRLAPKLIEELRRQGSRSSDIAWRCWAAIASRPACWAQRR